MKSWKTTLQLNHSCRSNLSRQIEIKCGIFQGYSLSPLLFCIALAPLSLMLNTSIYGYMSQYGKLNHLFYMDDLKTFTKDDGQQQGLLTIGRHSAVTLRWSLALKIVLRPPLKEVDLPVLAISLPTTPSPSKNCMESTNSHPRPNPLDNGVVTPTRVAIGLLDTCQRCHPRLW